MALATQCPHCGTLFRVAADQLKLRGGIVRCGACQQVFDGNTGLVDLNAPPSSPPSLPVAEPGTAPDVPATDDTEQPIYTLEFDRTLSPFGILPHPLTEQDEEQDVAVKAETAPAPVADIQVDEEIVAAPAPDDEHDEPEPAARQPAPDAPPLLLRESAGGSPPIVSPALSLPTKSPRARAADARSRRSKLTPTRIEDTPKLRVPEIDEPEFVRRGRQREQSSKAVRIAMVAGSLLLLLALALQAMVSFRDVLAARYPALRPALVSTCALFGCQVGLPARPDALVIETGELITLGGNAYTLSTVLRNGDDLALAWPSIELTLNDADDKPLVRRVFGPRDYAPQLADSITGFGARAEQPVKIHFRLEGLEPSGYHIAVFYP
ncbi:MJ0042 family finger-like domain-containing protein [Massilia aurea]|uniref:MJ0042 family finger-like domain-containing protein n=1 Tax=Massilia aurea TaxID=373040 RepID=A0A422QDN5_9BURK|nr:DUF3426 domain-containing protein [Massilia aurea]RNF28088.1 MJ0042 family finger-like domain-containing protein [Massilia aurea]